MRRITIGLTALSLVAAACSSDESADATAGPATTATTAAPETTPAGPATAPAEITFEPQESDGSVIVVASVTLPSSGFIAVHADGGGSPGPVIGHSDLLPAGTSANVEIALEEPLTETADVFPMAHIDVNEDGEYDFFPPDVTTDGPAQFAGGAVAVVGGEVTVAGATMADSVTLADTAFGPVLADVEGNTLYVFLPDNQGDSTCYDQCELNWPVFHSPVSTGDGVDASLVGEVERTDGSLQATYNGWPLYYFVNDAAPGDTNGQGVGDVWYVIDAAGEVVQG